MTRARLLTFLFTLGLSGLAGCDGDAPRSDPDPPPTTDPDNGATEATADPPATPETDVSSSEASSANDEPQGEPVNLLTAVPASLAVSSLYRDQRAMLGRLVDGALDGAWNSRSGDLVGAWIEVRLPADVAVTSIRLTVGFTRVTDRADLFTGNHRIARVRVSRDGEALGEHALDTDSRELQSLPVAGPGGVYRIEVLEVTPGTREDWRETCVSELQVMGRSADAAEGLRFPRMDVGELPELPPLEEEEMSDRGRALIDALTAFSESWGRLERDQISAEFNTGDPDVNNDEADELFGRRGDILRTLASAIAASNPSGAASLRSAASTRPTDYRWRSRRADMPMALQALSAAAPDAPFRCLVASAQVDLLFDRMTRLASWEVEAAEWGAMEMMPPDDEEPDPAQEAASDRANEEAEDDRDRIEDLTTDFTINPASVSNRWDSLPDPHAPSIRTEWDDVEAPMGVVRSSCGWGG